MKKLFVLLAIVTIVIASCGRVKKTEAPAEQDSTKVEVVDTTAAPVE